MKKILCLAFLVFLGRLNANNTDVHHLNGTIVDENNSPIENVGVYNKNTGDYSYSNASGNFVLNNISVNDVINFHILGFETKEMIVKEDQLDSTITVTLKESALSLDQVVLVSKINALSSIVNVDVKVSPIKSTQEILRKVPGLIIGQHAGGGKAEQIFLRGFDIDHGTDITINVDGLPVNLVSHAHGQGYADLHFVIPETIGNLDFGKGPYYADKGNFNTAGYVDLSLKKAIDNNLLSVEVGQFDTFRTVGLLKVLDEEKSSAYVATELVLTDGVFESPQNFNRFNIFGRYNYRASANEELTLTASHFQSKWDASGQIPQRAVDQGLISRFGAIDDTEGGNTSRSNLLVNHSKQLNENSFIKTKAYISKYDFELYSNFTFFLVDPVNGDQIRQREDRTIIGAETAYSYSFDHLNNDASFKYKAGIGFRYDDVNEVELSRTSNRINTLSRLSLGNVDEVNAYAFIDGTYKRGKWTLIPGLRIDYFKFDFENLLSPTRDNRSEDDFFISPKFNAIYAASDNVQLFAKAGVGFHSNDARVVTANTGEETLPGAFGADLGAILKPIDKLVINTALWGLYLQQEFVYVGDEAVVEPSGKTRRLGVDLGLRYQLNDWLFLYGDINYAFARSTEEPDGQDFIPLAPDLTSSGGLSIKDLGKFSGGINYRYIKDRPANEDNSIVAEGYFVTDLNLNYNFANNWTFGLIIENLLDTEWNETQFATETRLFNEPEAVEEITFTPGTPFSARLKLSVSF
ncbi:TonB-dependent receptor [Leptobacterium flavescens]|uniref:TonB-dependent receptor n=1 Tax=Leptobacterium flavescens TaxID=472055 RepID=A0A6P0UM73_9FLAO|nr:TonB-dependent receptor [Leptobacterium flavescens]NER13672.1 TonB-dependent receptor [Leptobacterium flavescens]